MEAYVTNDGLDLASGTTVGGLAIATGDGVPDGVIVMWSGALEDIPEGWSLCDGENGTPDLRGRFLVGVADSSTDPGDTGGSDSVTLTTDELPSHDHTVNDPGHSHSTNWVHASGSEPGLTGVKHAEIYSTLGTSTATTGVTLESSGSGSAFDNRPAFYTLAFLMKG